MKNFTRCEENTSGMIFIISLMKYYMSMLLELMNSVNSYLFLMYSLASLRNCLS